MRVLVCGGRDYDNVARAEEVLDALDIDVIIEGGARGADNLGYQYAYRHDILVETFPARWDRHGKAAGPLRNQRMLDEGKPDLVVAFPGGRGTADMVRRAKKAGVPVKEIS